MFNTSCAIVERLVSRLHRSAWQVMGMGVNAGVAAGGRCYFRRTIERKRKSCGERVYKSFLGMVRRRADHKYFHNRIVEYMIIYLIAQVCLVIFNLVNVRIDAYRILRHKQITHGINFGFYAVYCALLTLFAQWDAWQIIVFGVSAFCNRQFSFDIPLNRRRGLAWDYVTKANPPAAWLDRQEIRLFGYNGRAPFLVYGAVWVVCLIIKIWV
jgi:hypothetical protein